MAVNDQHDIQFAIVQAMLLWQPILGANRRKLAFLTDNIVGYQITTSIGRSQNECEIEHPHPHDYQT